MVYITPTEIRSKTMIANYVHARAGAFGLAISGCGDSANSPDSGDSGGLDTAGIEESLESTLGGSGSSLSSSSGPAITDVSCPETVDATSGSSFECTLSGDAGLTGSVTVTLKDDAGSQVE